MRPKQRQGALPQMATRTPNADYALARQAEPLATTFTCLFCNHEKSIAVKLNKKLGVGDLECKVCGQKFQCGINCTQTPAANTGGSGYGETWGWLTSTGRSFGPR